jgi:predicted RNase H-like nuclease (RuvC/YqgF family)
METRIPIAYVKVMSQALEKRVENLEQEFSALRAQVLDLRQRPKNWRSTVGTLEHGEMTREAERFGREYREQQTCKEEIAG